MIDTFIPTLWSDSVEHRRKIAESLTLVVDFINKLRYDSTIITLDANGDGIISFSTPCENGISMAVAVNGDIGATTSTCFSNLTVSHSSFAVHFRPNPGAINVRVNWLAIGL